MASGEKRSWFTVPCDQKFPTLVICHHQLQTAEQRILHINTMMCPYEWFTWVSICIQFGSSSIPDNDGRNVSCISTEDVNPHGSLEAFRQLLYHARWTHLDSFDATEDKHLMFILQSSHSISSRYLCVKPDPTSVQQCSSQQFQCSNGSCIPNAFHCNNILNCLGGTEEVDCSWTCTQTPCTTYSWPDCHCVDGFYQCEAGGCIPVDTVCDGTVNCADGSDEHYCELICWSSTRPCSDGLLCVADVHWCDGIQHCIDGSDELCPYDECTGFLCQDACIPLMWLNDGISDCKHSEDEFHFTETSFSSKICKAENYMPCEPNSVQHCYPAAHQCLYETEHTDDISFCRRGKHLMDCEHFLCSSTYKCPGAYCIPFGQVCDGNIDCPTGEDEKSCNSSCQGLFRCLRENICLSLYQVCNRKIDCHLSGDDEKYCSKKSHDLNDLKHSNLQDSTKDMILAFDRLHPSFQAGYYAHSEIITLENKLAPYQQLAVKFLDLSNNLLLELPRLIFWNFQQVRYLLLNTNKLTKVNALAFEGLKNMFYLDLSSNKLTTLALDMFDISTVSKFDVASNPLTKVEYGFFGKVQISSSLIPATDIMCCMLSDGSIDASCKSNGDKSVCNDLLVSSVLGYLLLLVCLLTAIPNLLCFSKLSKTTISFSLCLGNLVTSCLIVLPYLGVLGLQHFMYVGTFYYEKLHWSTSIYCHIAAFSAFVYSQMSLTMVGLIAAQRAYVTSFPFRLSSSKRMPLLVAISWSVWIAVALIPYITAYFNVFQMSLLNDMCLYHDLRLNNPWKTVFAFIFLGLNVALHILVILCSCITYRCVVQSTKNVRKSQKSSRDRVRRVRRTVAAVSLSNIVSHLPMILISLMTLCGLAPSDLMWAIIAVVVVPLPSMIYPIVYM